MESNKYKYIKLSEYDLRRIVTLYTDDEILESKLINTSRDDNDIRLNYIIHLKSDESFVIKLARNSFTTIERVNNWAELSKQYREAEIYCPMFLQPRKSKGYGALFIDSDSNSYVVFAEEYKKYKTIDEYIDEKCENNHANKEFRKNLKQKFGNENFSRQIAKSIGKIAESGKNRSVSKWNTAYVLYDKFCEDDPSDENYELAFQMYNMFKGNENIDQDLLENIWTTYLTKKNMFEKQYRKLPQAMFQGDLSWNNVLIDNELNFAGVIDFNLSGAETILNYIICEYSPSNSIGDNVLGEALLEPSFLNSLDKEFKFFMSEFCREYKISEEEVASFTTLYNIIVPFRYPFLSSTMYHYKKNNYMEVNYRLKWIYYQLTREDVSEAILG